MAAPLYMGELGVAFQYLKGAVTKKRTDSSTAPVVTDNGKWLQTNREEIGLDVRNKFFTVGGEVHVALPPTGASTSCPERQWMPLDTFRVRLEWL